MRRGFLGLLIAAFFLHADASLVPRGFWAILSNGFPWSANGTNATANYPKYFREAGKGAAPNHYDGRFQHGIVSPEVHADAALHMARAYLQFFREKNLETWLAHGTLLGWWWNGKRLPWDTDTDMQVSHPTLNYIAEHYNNTIYEYTSEKDDPLLQPPVKRSFLLDINPAYVERVKGNGNNIIDARWIDIRNGLFIDVTGVSETHPEQKPGVWSCKNNHRYNTSDLFPMRESMFEGVVAKIPYAYVRILTEEYHEKALVVTDFEGHRWSSESREWVKKSVDQIKSDRKTKLDTALQRVEAKKAKHKADKEAKKKGAKKTDSFGVNGEKVKEAG